MSSTSSTFFRATDIAQAMGWTKKTVHRTAKRDQWLWEQEGNAHRYQPPAEIAERIAATLLLFERKTMLEENAAPRAVRYADVANDPVQGAKVRLREAAVLAVQARLVTGKELALQTTVAEFRDPAFFKTLPPTLQVPFRISVSSLRVWMELYREFGIAGLVEQKRGRVGKKPYAAFLKPEQIDRLKAASIEYGVGGRQNKARAFQDLVADPTLSGPARLFLHGAHAKKSYYPGSVGAAMHVAPNAVKYIQQGPKAAALAGPHSLGSYGDDVPPGMAITADDMTANVYVWIEWPNEQGYLLIRPQVLAVMDVGSLAWLNVRAVFRPNGQYNKDDVWGTIGDTLEEHGLFKIAVFEGGTWQSNVIVGEKTGIEDETRFGGLRELGVKVVHTRTPRGKIIEGRFNGLQSAMDRLPGFAGRNERKDCPEKTKQMLAQVRSGKAHPRQFFLHAKDFTDHLHQIMQQLNHERSDGVVLRGRAPVDVWAEKIPDMPQVPESHKWLFRSAYNVVAVTKNGVRVTRSSGKYNSSHTYVNPAKLEHYAGQRVIVFWNDHQPETDAVVYTLRDKKPHQFLCAATHLDRLPKFSATKEELAQNEHRKALAAQMGASLSRSLAPHLQRRPVAAPVDSAFEEIGQEIAEAREEATERVAQDLQRRKIDVVDHVIQRAERLGLEEAKAETETEFY